MSTLRRIVDRAYGREAQADVSDCVLLQKVSVETRMLRSSYLDEGGRVQDDTVMFAAWATDRPETPLVVLSTLPQFDGLLAELSELRTKALLSAAVEHEAAAHA